jgi:hypothetical protein
LPVKGSYLAIAAVGGIFLWSSVKGKAISSVLRDVISGKPPSSAQSAEQIYGYSGYGYAASLQGGGGTPSQNQILGKALAAPYGWSVGQNWTDLVQLWNRESGWNQFATNPSSGAYGIPQALPPTKLPFSGQKAGGSNPASQIGWGLSYIKQEYGNPSNAWAHEESAGWY